MLKVPKYQKVFYSKGDTSDETKDQSWQERKELKVIQLNEITKELSKGFSKKELAEICY